MAMSPRGQAVYIAASCRAGSSLLGKRTELMRNNTTHAAGGLAADRDAVTQCFVLYAVSTGSHEVLAKPGPCSHDGNDNHEASVAWHRILPCGVVRPFAHRDHCRYQFGYAC